VINNSYNILAFTLGLHLFTRWPIRESDTFTMPDTQGLIHAGESMPLCTPLVFRKILHSGFTGGINAGRFPAREFPEKGR
jgi:hypothetical protein